MALTLIVRRVVIALHSMGLYITVITDKNQGRILLVGARGHVPLDSWTP